MMGPRLAALGLGVLADLRLGDPLGGFHIVVWMGKVISGCEKRLRPLFRGTPRGELAGGALTVLLVCALSFGASLGAVWLGWRLHWLQGLGVESFLCWQCLAARCLREESMAVYYALKRDGLPAARAAVGRSVGRDIAALDEAGVARACVETVAENCCDGVIAPLLFLALGGAPLGTLYKAVNTMDSMLGYKNQRYLYFGRPAAKLDDLANLLPARLGGLLMIGGAALCGQDGRGAWRVFRRDRYAHASPNSGHCEAACAGALGVRLGGPSVYFGQVVDKPYIGDGQRPVEGEDIRRANRLALASAALCFGLILLGKGALALC